MGRFLSRQRNMFSLFTIHVTESRYRSMAPDSGQQTCIEDGFIGGLDRLHRKKFFKTMINGVTEMLFWFLRC